MTDNSDQKYIDDLIARSEEALRLLSNEEKAKRERMTCAAFLRCLGVKFSSNDIESAQNDPPDVIFGKACFEITELLDERRRRTDEYKSRHERLKNATSIEDTLLPSRPPTSIPYTSIFDLVTVALSKKAISYGKEACSNLDALVYVNLRSRFLDPTTDISNFDSLAAQGWRSVSFVLIPYGQVIFAHDTAPDFLKLKAGKAKKEWNDPDTSTFFQLD